MNMDAKPCPKCNSIMATRRARAFSEYGGQDIYYFLDCTSCGYGPTIAFSSESDAITHWNTIDIMPAKAMGVTHSAELETA